MSFFQNPFDQEFQGYLGVGDKRTALTFIVPANVNKSDTILAWNVGPYDLSTDNTLTINYAWDSSNKNWAALVINIAGATAAATTVYEVVAILNANATFADMFTAEVVDYQNGKTVMIKAKVGRAKRTIKVYISNSSAEKKLRFNKKAGVAELPTFLARHTIDNRFNFEDSAGMLVELNVADAVDQNIITEAGLDYNNEREDWELLEGRSTNTFLFRKQTVNGNSQVTQIIEYPAGAVEGDLARKIDMTYTGTQTAPDTRTEIPYVLTSGDLITPP